jgi:hypothetical protein
MIAAIRESDYRRRLFGCRQQSSQKRVEVAAIGARHGGVCEREAEPLGQA